MCVISTAGLLASRGLPAKGDVLMVTRIDRLGAVSGTARHRLRRGPWCFSKGPNKNKSATAWTDLARTPPHPGREEAVETMSERHPACGRLGFRCLEQRKTWLGTRTSKE